MPYFLANQWQTRIENTNWVNTVPVITCNTMTCTKFVLKTQAILLSMVKYYGPGEVGLQEEVFLNPTAIINVILSLDFFFVPFTSFKRLDWGNEDKPRYLSRYLYLNVFVSYVVKAVEELQDKRFFTKLFGAPNDTIPKHWTRREMFDFLLSNPGVDV